MFNATRSLGLVLFTLLMFSCQKEISVELGKGGTSNVSTTLKMKIDGSQWTANQAAGASVIAGFININGVSNDGKSLSITLNDTVPGTYIMDQLSFNSAAYSDSLDLGGVPYSSSDGKDTTQAGGVVVVTTIDRANHTISGTFQFKAYRDFDSKQKKITEGVFDKLSYTSTLPAASITDTFRVKIDNADWTAKSISGSISGTNLVITGSEPDLSKLVALSIPSNITVGTYNLDVVTGTYIAIYSPGSTSVMPSLSGKLTILERNSQTKRIRANFNFTAAEPGSTKLAQLTAGYFSVVYQ